MSEAIEFGLDVQEAMQSRTLTQERFAEIYNNRGGDKQDDGITVKFPDGSSAIWREEQQAFEIKEPGVENESRNHGTPARACY